MEENRLLSIKECCELLKVSRPTFDKIRKNYELHEYIVGSRPRFNREEIFIKILKSQVTVIAPLVVKTELEALCINQVDLDKEFSGAEIDIDRFSLIDVYYVSVLLCKLIIESTKIKRKILSSKGLKSSYFTRLNFLPNLVKFARDIEIDKTLIVSKPNIYPEIILPISQVGFKTAEKRYLEEIRTVLKTQGFSTEIGDYIGWTLGELADNSHTHSGSNGKVFISIERLSGREHNFLQINILDMGEGIQKTLKKNEKYASLSDEEALLMAFKSKVSSWGDEHNRGKGLTDILKIAFECNSFFRVESCGLAFMFYCQKDRRKIERIIPSTKIDGTRFSITLIDNEFRETKRTEVNAFIDDCLEHL